MFKTLLFGLIAALVLAAGAVRADILIATAGPMTGPFAAFGEQLKRGAQLAVTELNANGGVLGQKVRLVNGNDACDPRKAMDVAKSMVNKGIRFMAGHFCSAASIVASDIYAREGILQISPSSTEPMLTERGLANVFRVSGRDDQQGVIAGNYLADNFGGKKVAIVHDNRTYAKALATATKAQLNRRGMNEDLFTTVTPGAKDYGHLVNRISEMRIDVLYYGGYHREAAMIVRQMRDKGLSTALVSGDDLATGQFWAVAGTAGEGALMTYLPDPKGMVAAQAVLKELRDDRFRPDTHAIHSYAAVQVWAQAVSKAGSMQLEKVTKAMRANVFQTALGEISFNRNGDIRQPAYAWYEWRKGKFAEKQVPAEIARK